MRLLRAGARRATPWKNGGGSTTEIAVAPAGAPLDAFDWRISMAQVGSDGPFSAFPGIDRTLAVIDGDGLQLTIDGGAALTLGRWSEPIGFAGDAATSARLTAGAITDLNVMTRRSRFSHRLQRLRAAAWCDFDGNGLALVLSLRGRTSIGFARQTATLDDADAAILTRGAEDSFRVAPDVECYLVWLRQL